MIAAGTGRRTSTGRAIQFRTATVEDATAVADVYLESRKTLVSCAPLVHTDEEVRAWIRESLIPTGRVTVAVADGVPIGVSAVSSGADASWIDQLYVRPAWIGRGVGGALLELARRQLHPPIRLFTFQENERARRFYERRGFEAIAFGDGSGNEEGCPDVLYEWRGAGHVSARMEARDE